MINSTYRKKLCLYSPLLALFFSLPSFSASQSGEDAKALPGILVGDRNGWQASFDGLVNAYFSYIDGDNVPAGVEDDGVIIRGSSADEDVDSFRLRTGFVPAALGLNVKAPTKNGYRLGARLGLYPSIQNDRAKNANTNLDIREVYFTISRNGSGEFQIGRSLSLFHRQHLLLDTTEYGIGLTTTGGNGPASGRTGFGYLYPNFAASVIYRLPSSSNFNLALGLYDPSKVQGAQDSFGQVVSADIMKTPRVEGELTYDIEMSDATIRLFGNALWQQAEFSTSVPNIGTLVGAQSGDDVTAWGIGFGASAKFGKFQWDVAGYDGEALGTDVMLDSNALDPLGEEREHSGWYTQFRYELTDNLSTALSIGETTADETAGDIASGRSFIEEQSSFTITATYQLTDYVKLNFETSSAETQYTGGEDQDNNIYAAGITFQW